MVAMRIQEKGEQQSKGENFPGPVRPVELVIGAPTNLDRKSTRLNSSHLVISYAVFCLKKKTIKKHYNDRCAYPPLQLLLADVLQRLGRRNSQLLAPTQATPLRSDQPCVTLDRADMLYW